MGLIGYTPDVLVTGAAEKTVATINARLLSWELTDASGNESDRLRLVVDTHGIEDHLPSKGQRIGFEVGYLETGRAKRGEFDITRITPRLFPSSLEIVATAAPFQAEDETEFKLRRSASFGPTTLGDVFRQLATRHGFSPRIAADLEALVLEHVDQTDETDMSFLTRLAREHDAVAKPINALYVMAKRGKLKTVSGQDIKPRTLSVPAHNEPGKAGFCNASLDRAERQQSNGCRARWSSTANGQTEQVEVGEKPFKRLRQCYPTEGTARAAALAEWRRMDRDAMRIRLDVPGDPTLVAEGLAILDETWPASMRGSWSMDRVISRGDRQGGYRCSIEATLPTEK